VDEPLDNDPSTVGPRPPPELPKRLLDPWPVVLVGTAAWVVATLVLLVLGIRDVRLWTTVAGWGLGFVGMGIIAWQRAASRRGSRSAQRGL
jgi:hypothetical protein